MYFHKVNSFSVLPLFLAAVNGLAVPTTSRLQTRDVYSPKILTPTTGTVWQANSIAQVTWDTSNPPAHITNPQGTIFLASPNSTSEIWILVNHPLASRVNLTLGLAKIRVPNVPTGTNYTVVLMGDSGNCSPMFTIQSGSGSPSSSDDSESILLV
ncbi:hypothetical protein BT96DRAFT_811941 [Gymnopus androsaceus JB14]|uniref:Ser-Thr-rich glycosyl-phosphatidyl-inositol-anchored membrane family-domain-containing protein n=1 Tax=Gymnopus androsaceus JB14 TaxID=1447944 RepID=A0A6A4I9D3_9AGAR|nr:hypothetical protein BT96DRAFT_811941 [Gymnopus androsaceus JB14]